MKEEELNKMWKEISKLNFRSQKARRYMWEFLTDEEQEAVNREYNEWCAKQLKNDGTGSWNACMGCDSDEAYDNILKKHVDESVVALSVDGRKKLLAKVMDTAEKLLANFGLDMPEIEWKAYHVSRTGRFTLALVAQNFMYRGVHESEDKVVERCLNKFLSFVYFYGTIDPTHTTGKAFEKWKKQVLEDMANGKYSKNVEIKVDGKTVELADDPDVIVKKKLWNKILSCYDRAKVIKKDAFIRYLDKAVDGWYDWLCEEYEDYGDMIHFIDDQMGDDSDSADADELFDNGVLEWKHW